MSIIRKRVQLPQRRASEPLAIARDEYRNDLVVIGGNCAHDLVTGHDRYIVFDAAPTKNDGYYGLTATVHLRFPT